MRRKLWAEVAFNLFWIILVVESEDERSRWIPEESCSVCQAWLRASAVHGLQRRLRVRALGTRQGSFTTHVYSLLPVSPLHILVLLVMTAGEKRETRQIWVQLTPQHSSGQNVSQIVNMSTCGACRRICPLGQGNKGARSPVSKEMPNLLSLIQSPTGHLQAQLKSRCFRQKWPLCP